MDDQHRLSELIDLIKQRGAYYILSNASHSRIEEIFEKGDRKLRLSRANLIGGKKAVRGPTKELVITNIKDQL